MADGEEYVFSPMNMTFLWPDPLEDRHKEYNRFFDLDDENRAHLNYWLEQKLPRDPRRPHFFVLDDGFLAVRRADERSSVTFVFGDGLLEVFRQFVLETGIARGLKFKHWRVDADHIQHLLNLSVSDLENICSDYQFRAAVKWWNDVYFETRQLGNYGEFGFVI